MPTINIKCNADAMISVNGQFAGIIKSGQTLTLPTGTADTVISAMPSEKGYIPACCIIENGERLAPCNGQLCRWSDDIYELELELETLPEACPPLLIGEQKWNDGFAGMCGGYFVCESARGEHSFFPKKIKDFRLVGSLALLELDSGSCVIDRSMNTVFPQARISACDVSGDVLSVSFSPGDMDYFEITERISVSSGNVLSSNVEHAELATRRDMLRCFCQAVRLKLADIAMSFLSPTLDMRFDEIEDFLGVFDRTDPVRYIACNSETSIALRYKLDENNYDYMCYEFDISSDGKILINDITQI